LRREVERLAHRRAVLRVGIEPDRKFDAPRHGLAITADLLEALLHPQRPLGEVTDGHEVLVDAVGRTDERLHAIAVADDAYVKVIAHAALLGAAQDEVLQEAVDDIGEYAGLAGCRIAALFGPAEGILHRGGLIQQKKDGRRVGAANLGGIRHKPEYGEVLSQTLV